MPGLWLMAIAPLALAYYPSIPSAISWIFLASVGEVIWSPRQSAWIASIAPDGREGVFLALLSLKSLITTIPSTMLNGYLNMAFNPNCPSCRDPTGHFCDTAMRLNATALGCAAAGTPCIGGDYGTALVGSESAPPVCPRTCVQCPGYTDAVEIMWSTVLLASIASPVMVQLSLPFLRSVDSKPPSATKAGGKSGP